MAVLLEREDQLARLESALAAAREGEGRLVVVEGPAGMGKTALLHVLRTRAEAAGMRVLRARGAELEQEFGYGIVRQLFEPPLMIATPEERADLLAGAAGLAAERLGFAGAAAVPGDVGGGRPDAAFAVLHGLYWLCANLAARRPLVLVGGRRALGRRLLPALPRLPPDAPGGAARSRSSSPPGPSTTGRRATCCRRWPPSRRPRCCSRRR